jgi:conjugal transfer pilin signal peptidase TrbI
MTALVRERPIERWRPRKRLWAMLGIAIVGAIFIGEIRSWRDSHVLLINTTESLPNWAFMIRRHQLPARGDYVFFDPPPSTLLRRHFGAKPQMFGKMVYGMPGDVVRHRGIVVTINGAPIGRLKPRTRSGEPLTPGAIGTIPLGCYYAGSPHPDGFDSRYAEIGFVCGRQIVGVGEPVL